MPVINTILEQILQQPEWRFLIEAFKCCQHLSNLLLVDQPVLLHAGSTE
ncbi:hypothetical protein tinsulaeT_17010 [Thalassotalea insulae]|uniref:Uncharacterized protein n=1 Tax=Thalassotalea insulae TaxID=2056778 RepID=A0ABQ6GUK5_9GAMM|nr:hypothetical protein tinsulaeT_17010 [Thalassotalea insulae]